MACRKNSPGKPCCTDPCCTPIELPDETWDNVPGYDCCIQKIIDVDPDDSWHIVCSLPTQECTQTQSSNLRVYRHLYPVVNYTYGCDEPDPVDCVAPKPGDPLDCYIEGVLIPHCSSSTEECGLFSVYGTATTTQKIVLKYRHLRDIITITKLTSTCLPDEAPSCKYLIVFQKEIQAYYGQVNFGSSLRTVSSLTGCCKVVGSSVSVSAISCEQAANNLTTLVNFTISRSGVFDTIPDEISFSLGDKAECDPLPSGLCVYPGNDGPVLCSTDVPVPQYANAVCTCVDTAVRCYAITVGTNTCNGDVGCIIREPYPAERHTTHICGASTPGGIKLLPDYSVSYDGTTCYVDCQDSIAGVDNVTYHCPPNPASFCRSATGFISKIECEGLTSETACAGYVERCISILTGEWALTIVP